MIRFYTKAVGSLLLVPLVIGCSRKADSGPWLSASKDPTQIASAMDAAEKARVKDIENLGQVTYIDSDTMNLIDRSRQQSIDRLSKLLDANTITDPSVGASLLLCRLEQQNGRDHAKRILNSGNEGQRVRLINGLVTGLYAEKEIDKYKQFLFADREFADAMANQLDDPNGKVVGAAIQTCGFLSFPGVNEKFTQMLQRPNVASKDRLLFWLSKGELTESLFDLAVVATKESQPTKAPDTWIFEAFAKSPNEALRKRGKDYLREVLRQWPSDGRPGFDGNRLGVLTVISEAADKGDLDWLLQLIHSERGMYAADPLRAYLRLAPVEGRAMLMQWLQDGQKRDTAIEVAATSFAKTQDEEVVKALDAQASRAGEEELESICRALGAIGGASANGVIDKYAAKLDPATLSYIRQSNNKVPLATIVDAVVSKGLLSKQEADTAVKEIGNEGEEESPGLFELFLAAKSAIIFDAEADMVPCRHDSLVLEFAKASRGRFHPEAVVEIWQQKNEDDYEAPYTLQFVCNGTLYKGNIRNMGDWYDVERVAQMINTALAESGSSERFIALASGGQDAMFVFADPVQFTDVAAKFNVALSDDLGSAYSQGIEFEKKVLEQLRQSER